MCLADYTAWILSGNILHYLMEGTTSTLPMSLPPYKLMMAAVLHGILLYVSVCLSLCSNVMMQCAGYVHQ